MNGTMKVMAKCAAEPKSAHLRQVSRAFCCSSRSQGTPPLRWQQSASQQVQVRQREGGVQPRGVLRQATVAHFAKAPQALDHMEGMLDTGPGTGAQAVDEL